MKKLVLCMLALLTFVVGHASVWGDPYFDVTYSRTGETIACSEDSTAFVNVIDGSLNWSKEFLSFSSETDFILTFDLKYNSLGQGNQALGANSAWCHTYDMRIQYVVGPPASLTLINAEGIAFPFVFDPAAGLWRSPASSGLFLTCTVGNGFTLADKLGNTMLFDATGRLTSIVDYLGRTINLSYYTYGAANGLLWQVTDMWGRAIELVYDNTPLLTSVLDLTAATNPTWLSLSYTGNLLTQVRSGYFPGLCFANHCFDYDGVGRMSSYCEPDLSTTVFAYSSGRLSSSTDALGGVWSFSYNPGNSTTSFSDRRGNSFIYTYNPSLNAITQISSPAPTAMWGSAATERWFYNSNRLATQYIDRRGNSFFFSFDSVGNKLSDSKTVTTPAGPSVIVRTWTYTSSNRVFTFTNARGFTTTNSYDAFNRLSSITYPTPGGGGAAPVETYLYDANSLISSVSDPLLNTVTKTYDANGNISSITTPLGNTTNFTYDSWGHRLTNANPVGMVQSKFYNSLYQLIAEEAPYGTVSQGGILRTEYTRSAGGRILAKKMPNDVLNSLGDTYVYTRNALNRITVETDCYGNSKYYDYDANGNRILYTHAVDFAAGRTTTAWTFDTWNRMYAESDAIGFTTTSVLDANGNVLSMTDKCGNTTTSVYDELNRKTSSTDALGYVRY